MTDDPQSNPARQRRLHDELHALFMAETAGTLDTAGRERLESLVIEDPQARGVFVQYMLQTACLQSWSATPAEEADPPQLASRFRRFRHEAYRRATRPTPLSFALSGLFMACLLSVLAMWTWPLPVTSIGESPFTRASFVARLGGTHQSQWSAATEGLLDEGADLPAGTRLELLSGLAEIRFDSGAVVLLEGPATCTPLDDNRLALERGRLAARVPAAAVGFTIRAPRADLVDLGTEFAVEQHPDPASELDLHVYAGAVEVSPRDGGAAPIVVGSGQGIRIGADGEVESRNTGGEDFRRELPRHPRYARLADFEPPLYRPGPLDGQHRWRVDSRGADVRVVDADSGRRLSISGGRCFFHRALQIAAIPNGRRGAVYVRLYPTGETLNLLLGLSHQGEPAGFDDYRVQVRLFGDGERFRLEARDADRFVPLTPALPVRTWYDLWLFIDNGRDRFDVVLQGGPHERPTVIGRDVQFREPNHVPLQTFFIATGGDLPNDAVYLDQIQFLFQLDQSYENLARPGVAP